MIVDIVKKVKVQLDPFDCVVFGYEDAEGKKYLSGVSTVKAFLRMDFPSAKAYCRSSVAHSHFDFMEIAGRDMDLLRIDDKERVDTVLGLMFDKKGWTQVKILAERAILEAIKKIEETDAGVAEDAYAY